MSQSAVVAQEISLRCHPASDCVSISAIRVMLQRLSATQLQLNYLVSGDLAGLRIPAVVKAERRDELWRHTCAELFVAEPDRESYVEFNFSPSTCWAAYEFSGYRQDMRAADCEGPTIAVKQGGQMLEVEARLQLPERFAATHALQASVTMVIEDGTGQYSYWVVQHAIAKPDFHCRQSFVLNI